jgi:hypothetical protein
MLETLIKLKGQFWFWKRVLGLGFETNRNIE